MVDFLCKTCDRSLFENEFEHQHYRATLRKKNDKSLYKKYTINNINLVEYDKLSNDYNTTHNKNFDVYLIICDFKIEFDNNFIVHLETGYVFNIESEKKRFIYYTQLIVLN